MPKIDRITGQRRATVAGIHELQRHRERRARSDRAARRAEARADVGAHDAGLRENVGTVGAVAGIGPAGFRRYDGASPRLQRRRHQRGGAYCPQRMSTVDEDIALREHRQCFGEPGIGVCQNGQPCN